jgi:tRNA pseudouridine38-40 synthase
MALYQVILSYDGTDFQGFQRQKNARTVQGELEASLKKIGWRESTIQSAGRTDTGVHASGQVVTFELDWNHPPEELCSALNSALPPDVSVRSAQAAESGFHPRYDATYREYCYRVYTDLVRDPLKERYQWRVIQPLNFEDLQQAAQIMIGRHDFTAFGRPPRPTSSTIREVTLSHWVKQGEQLQYHVRANAFLYHMVRRLVFIQVAVAAGKVDLSELANNLERGCPDHPGIAPAHGLELAHVAYAKRDRLEVLDL